MVGLTGFANRDGTPPEYRSVPQPTNQPTNNNTKEALRSEQRHSSSAMGILDKDRTAMGISTAEPEPEPEPDPLEEFGDMCPKLTLQQVRSNLNPSVSFRAPQDLTVCVRSGSTDSAYASGLDVSAVRCCTIVA